MDKITILFNNQNQNCYITDWSKMNAKLNGTPVEIKALYSDENGYARALEILLGSPGEDINTVTFKYPPVYINKDVDDQAEIVASSLMTCSLKYRITLNSTLESADDFVRSDLPKHVQNLKYTYDNPPGEYGALVGDYGIDFSDMYMRYYPNPHNGNYRPYVMDDQGKLVTYCTEQIDRSYVVRDDDVKFHITIDNPITIPGTYWIVYISDGDYRYYDSTGKYYNLRHLANMKIGPYVVKEQAGGEMHTVDAQLGLWNKEEYESDMLPSVIGNTIVNASAVVCHKSATSGYASNVVQEADSVAVSANRVR
ncbi:MAG: hypothetical protein K2J17_00585, partial [Paramuribaculum sp.]|nr:hypothetical protein [Paramuribaculum sp.]